MTCRNCGGYVDPNSKFCLSCGTPTETQTKTKKKKKLPIIIVSIILIFAIVAGIVTYVFKSNPYLTILSAAKNTVFNSSELEISYRYNHEDNDFEDVQIGLVFGDDINSSSFDMYEDWEYTSYDCYYDEYYEEWIYSDVPNIYSGTDRYSIKNGKVYINDEFYDYSGNYLRYFEDEFSHYLPSGVDLEDEINNILNGKLDEKSFESAFDNIIAPFIEDIIRYETGKKIELPGYKEIFGNSGTIAELFKNKAVKESILLKKIKSNLPGTTYEYTIKVDKLVEAVMVYALENEQYRDYLEIAAKEYDYSYSADDIAETIIERFENFYDITGSITVKSNQITNLLIEFPYEDTIEITVESK